MQKLKIIGVDIFLEKRKTRLHVGTITKEQDTFIFKYAENYFKAKNAIPFGPEFPLTQRQFESGKLFASLEDRIPSHQNPAYSEYCQVLGVDPKESNPLILLSTIGRKGPSSFIFYPIFERQITVEELIKFRQSLGFTTREFAKVFELSQSSLNALEKKRALGKDLLKRLEIILKFPSVALYFLTVNGGTIIHDKMNHATSALLAKSDLSDTRDTSTQ